MTILDSAIRDTVEKIARRLSDVNKIWRAEINAACEQ
jgi:hypothetical protein